MTSTTRKPFCKCLYEIENNLQRTIFCMIPCRAQLEIRKQRVIEEKNATKKDK